MKYLLALAILFNVLFAQAQRYDSVLNILDERYPQERMYLHFDKQFYNPGETIWFKAYLFSNQEPSGISKTMYAELLDDQGKLLQRKTIPIVLASAASSFDLPLNIASSNVMIRTYTQWMLNFDSSFLYVKSIPVNVAKKQGKAGLQPSSSIQFFPEGGDMINGLIAKVAFKAVDNRGFPITARGDILDNQNKKILSFSSVHDGMGFFIFQPAAGVTYKAQWKDQRGVSYETVLPPVRPAGVTLEVKNQGNRIQFAIRRSQDAPDVTKFVTVVAQMHHQLVYRARANMAMNSFTSGAIPVDKIPTGILHVTLFDEQSVPLAERIVMVNMQEHSFITDLNAALKKFEKRERNVIQIDVPDTIACNLSVSVTDANVFPKMEEDIFSGILLTSDIKGYVHNPAYYFSSEADSVAAHLDLVMMTNGWRRFRWEDALAGRWPSIRFKPEGYLGIRGTVSGLSKNVLAQKEITGILKTKEGPQQVMTIPIESDGTFLVPDILFFDTARMYYQINNDKTGLTARASFDFRNTFLNEPLKIPPPLEILSKLDKPDSVIAAKNRVLAEKIIDQQRKVQTLEAVEVRAQARSKKEKFEAEYTSGFFTGDGMTFITEDDPIANSSMSVFHYLQSRVAGLQITTGGIGGPTLSWRGGPPGLFLDQIQMDAQALQSIPMSNVAMVKVFRPPFFGGMGGGSNGAIAVYTKRGGGSSDFKGLDAAVINGYSPMKQFYSPDYSVKDPSHPDDDYRTTLYWNPYVLTDKDKRRILLTFYNNDITKKFRVVVEGCNAYGKLTRIEKVFE